MALKRFLRFLREKRSERRGRKDFKEVIKGICLEFLPLYRVWPELGFLQSRARKILIAGGKEELFHTITREVLGGKLVWIPEKKRGAAYSYVLLKVAGIQIQPKKLLLLWLNIVNKGFEES